MRRFRWQGSPLLAVLVAGGVQLRAGSSQAAPLANGARVHSEAPSGTADEQRGRDIASADAVLARLLRLGESAEAGPGGQVALARRQADSSSARRAAAWLDWLPDFSLAVRRQVEEQTDTDVSAPRWRLDLEGQVGLSLQKATQINIAQAANSKARAELEQVRREARGITLRDAFALYLVERKAQLFGEQVAQFETLRAGMAKHAQSEARSDATLIESYLAELRGKLAEQELERREAARNLSAALEAPVEQSGLDPELELPTLLALIRSQSASFADRVAQVQQADTKLEERRLRWAQSQSWYLPELRASTLLQIPQGTPGSADGASFRLTDVTTELTLGLRLRPGVPALQAAQQQAVVRSGLEAQQSQWLRGQAEDQARTRRDAFSSLWLNETGIRSARQELQDTRLRFARGERGIAELAAASRAALAAGLNREAILRGAVLAQITLSELDSSGLAARPEIHREELAPAQVNIRSFAAVDSAPAVRSARAEAERAAQRARSEAFSFGTALEAGISLPLYQTGDTAQDARPELTFAGPGPGNFSLPVRETSVLGRWSLDLRTLTASRRAFQSEAQQRQAQAELERMRYLWSELGARLELAQARKAVELSRSAAQFELESLQREQRWFQQGAASESDLRAAAVSQQTAETTQGMAEARLRGAELLLASYLGAGRGTLLTVSESVEGLERWAREELIPENGLFGFENRWRRRVAELEAESAHARTESLANPPRSAAFTAQATQGLRGGAFSLTVALSVALDPARELQQITRAAELEGAARGRVSTFEKELEQQRARLAQRLDEANALLESEGATQARLGALTQAVLSAQAAAPDIHDAVKQRELGAIQRARFESQRRQLQAEEERRSAALGALALGEAPGTARALPMGASNTLRRAVRALTEQSTDVAIADAAASGARSRQPTPGVSALHLVGPFAVGAYGADRVVGPSTSKVWRGDFGVGVQLGLDESLAPFGSHALAKAAELDQAAARQAAVLQAIHELGLTWTARELERLSAQEEADARHYLEASVGPRFTLGQVTPAMASEAEQRLAFARLRHASDEARLRSQRSLLGVLGALPSEQALQEYQHHAEAELAARASQPTPQPRLALGAAELAAQSRARAASSATMASALRVVSPVTGLVEFRPAQINATTGTDEDRKKTTGHELLWVFSLLVPFKPKELGSLAVASAEARRSDEELAAQSRKADLRRSSLLSRLEALRQEQVSATARRLAAERARSELDRRLHAAEDHTSIDEVAEARQGVFDARRVETVASGAVMETALSLRALEEDR